MARIEAIELHHRLLVMRRPFVTAVRTAYSMDAVFVEVRDSDGRRGWGEAPTSWRVTGESVAAVTAAVNGAAGIDRPCTTFAFRRQDAKIAWPRQING